MPNRPDFNEIDRRAGLTDKAPALNLRPGYMKWGRYYSSAPPEKHQEVWDWARKIRSNPEEWIDQCDLVFAHRDCPGDFVFTNLIAIRGDRYISTNQHYARSRSYSACGVSDGLPPIQVPPDDDKWLFLDTLILRWSFEPYLTINQFESADSRPRSVRMKEVMLDRELDNNAQAAAEKSRMELVNKAIEIGRIGHLNCYFKTMRPSRLASMTVGHLLPEARAMLDCMSIECKRRPSFVEDDFNEYKAILQLKAFDYLRAQQEESLSKNRASRSAIRFFQTVNTASQIAKHMKGKQNETSKNRNSGRVLAPC